MACIKRNDMPQVDMADYDGLFAHLNSKGVFVTPRSLPPTMLTIKQCLHETRAARNPLLLKKPILIAMDLAVVDGSHRLMRYLEEKATSTDCFEIGLNFQEACQAILTYPKAYRYGDGPQPYRI